MEKENIFLSDTKESMPYKTIRGGGGKNNYPLLEQPLAHVRNLKQELDSIVNSAISPKQVAAIKIKDGFYLDISGKQGYDLNYKALEDERAGIQLLNIQSKDDLTKATIFVPRDKTSILLNKFNQFESTLDTGGNPKNNDLVRSIDIIREADVASFWQGPHENIPTSDIRIWCEVWLSTEKQNDCDVLTEFKLLLNEFDITYKNEHISFPERIVMLIFVNNNDLVALLQCSKYIAELNKCEEPNSFFIKESLTAQYDWVDDIKNRLQPEDSNATICLLDTGVSSAHPLLEPFMQEQGIHTVFDDGDLSDYGGHGTGMAGIALYQDLNLSLLSRDTISIPYRIESSKILRRQNNDSELYGAITAQGILFNEIENPDKDRSICMAVTADTTDGLPTSWSGAIDEIVAGVNVSSGGNENKRLMLISAGNALSSDLIEINYPDVNINSYVQNPGQSWNAVTVGAYNSKINIDDTDFLGYQPVADVGELSPYSSTSVLWDNKWPIKPEILMDGGNIACKDNFYSNCDDLSLLTTNNKLSENLFSTIWATSAATAQASKLSAEIYCKYPNAWPETIRALMVHSARWTDKMKQQFLPSEIPKKSDIRVLLRTCGYGIPNLERAVSCKNNYVNMIIEEELQPFDFDQRVVTNELHIHKLPWPKEVLESLGDKEVELRVTLSYYIEPSPGHIGWKEKYTYQSCGLRFELKNSMESLDDFKKRVNQIARDEDPNWRNELGSSSWYLGVNNRNVGSIHSDFMCVPAIDLSNANDIAVYPVSGWWKNRKRLKRYYDKIRYSLIISLSTKDTEVDFYTPIITEIQMPIKIEIS
ncbi:S8 family peptidase [Veillonella sp. AS16]|uniref:S8 family peptidase n=1 Tax=Veillonella sp. AS16 TaxID=936589 RepID=UPI0003E2AA37|nr:S8 family peptidase [Veillonella sp. AS16]ETS92668.1 peptidase, S8/S53 family [Veillonella sp. AS16]